MRLFNYLTEGRMTDQEVVLAIRKECSQYLKEVGEQRIHRGTNTIVREYEIVTPRIGRMPKDTPIEVHRLFDDAFNKKFGWKVRSEGVFTSGDPDVAESFGAHSYIFYPANGYKYVWSDIVIDLTHYLSENGPDPNARFTEGNLLDYDGGRGKYLLKKENFDNDDNRNTIVKNVMSTYTDKGLKTAISKGHEISFKCSYYYLIEGSFFTKYYDNIYRGQEFE